MTLDLRSSEDVSDRLVAAAIALAGEEGAAALSSRALADRAGLSASAVNYRFGSLETLIDAARAAGDASRAAHWRRLFASLEDASGEQSDFGPFVFAALREVAVDQRGAEALFWAETIDAARTGGKVARSDAVEAERAYWDRLLQVCGVAAPRPILVQAVALAVRFGYAVFPRPEAFDAWALALVLRFAGRAAGEAPIRAADCFSRRQAEQRASARLAPDIARHETAQRILRAAISLILEEGIGTLTHRRIARDAGLSVSSVLHFYGARENLLEAAYHALYEQARQRAVPELPPAGTLDAKALIVAMSTRPVSQDAGQMKSFAAMQGLILSAAASERARPIAKGLLARAGGTSMSLLASLKSPRGAIGRIDAQLFSMALSQAATLELCDREDALRSELDLLGLHLVETLFEAGSEIAA